jgi:hypothetical protein
MKTDLYRHDYIALLTPLILERCKENPEFFINVIETYIDTFDYKELAELMVSFFLKKDEIEKMLADTDIEMSVENFKKTVEQDLKSSL